MPSHCLAPPAARVANIEERIADNSGDDGKVPVTGRWVINCTSSNYVRWKTHSPTGLPPNSAVFKLVTISQGNDGIEVTTVKLGERPGPSIS